MCYLSYFINLSKVRPCPCSRAFVITGWRVDRTVCTIYLALSSVALLSSSHFFKFKRCAIQHLGLSEKSQELRSVLGGSSLIVCVQRFQRRLQIFSKIIDHFCASCLAWFVQSSRQHPLLLSGFCFHIIFSSDVIVGLFFLGSLFKRGLEIIVGTDSQLRATSREIFSLYSGCFIPWQEGFDGFSPLLSDGSSCGYLFPLVLYRSRELSRRNRIFFSSVRRVCDY